MCMFYLWISHYLPVILQNMSGKEVIERTFHIQICTSSSSSLIFPQVSINPSKPLCYTSWGDKQSFPSHIRYFKSTPFVILSLQNWNWEHIKKKPPVLRWHIWCALIVIVLIPKCPLPSAPWWTSQSSTRQLLTTQLKTLHDETCVT